MAERRTYGLEIEKVVSKKDDALPHGMSQEVFRSLGDQAEARGVHVHDHESDVKPGVSLGVVSDDLGEQGVDNGFNLQETALPYQYSLRELKQLATMDVKTVQTALAQEGATTINMSIHPLGSTDQATYKAFVAPKSVYPYILQRGWDHSAGIDAKAQNSPATGIPVDDAAEAVTAIMGAGAAFVGIFGNSPFAEGKPTGQKESRLTIWDRMMTPSRVKGDLRTSQFPEKPFTTLADYFTWMYGGDSGIHFVLKGGSGQNYKTLGDRVVIVDDDPSVLTYLSKDKWTGRLLTDLVHGKTDAPVEVTPDMSHMEAMQFAQFAGARVRFGLKEGAIDPKEFAAACKDSKGRGVEKLFAQGANYTYIEGRDPGSNLPDQQLWNQGADVAQSVVMAPSAIQAGLLQNLREASAFITGFNWQHLGELRKEAIRNGLQGEVGGVRVADFAAKIVDIAGRGLSQEDQALLKYPELVLSTGKNGADRALDFVAAHPRGGREALVDLVKSREVILK